MNLQVAFIFMISGRCQDWSTRWLWSYTGWHPSTLIIWEKQPLRWDLITIWFPQMNSNTWPNWFGLSLGLGATTTFSRRACWSSWGQGWLKVAHVPSQSATALPGWSERLCWKPAGCGGSKFEDLKFCIMGFVLTRNNIIQIYVVIESCIDLSCSLVGCTSLKPSFRQKVTKARRAMMPALLGTQFLYFTASRKYFVAQKQMAPMFQGWLEHWEQLPGQPASWPRAVGQALSSWCSGLIRLDMLVFKKYY